ncbi:MAG: RNA polymerase sigma factor [Clostridia bacterium]|nr:RNA polymerase sigma factor [Clostridia bacterium]
MDDNMIIEAFFARNEDALQSLKEKYGATCARIAANVLQDGRDVEECVNDALLKLWNAIPPLRPDNLRAYLYTAVRNTAISRARQAKHELPLFDELSDVALSDSTDEVYVAEALSRFLRGLPRMHRIIFVKRYYYCASYADIANECGKSEGTVKSIISRTKEKLKKELER